MSTYVFFSSIILFNSIYIHLLILFISFFFLLLSDLYHTVFFKKNLNNLVLSFKIDLNSLFFKSYSSIFYFFFFNFPKLVNIKTEFGQDYDFLLNANLCILTTSNLFDESKITRSLEQLFSLSSYTNYFNSTSQDFILDSNKLNFVYSKVDVNNLFLNSCFFQPIESYLEFGCYETVMLDFILNETGEDENKIIQKKEFLKKINLLNSLSINKRFILNKKNIFLFFGVLDLNSLMIYSLFFFIFILLFFF